MVIGNMHTFTQISKWSSPAPATMCSPDSEIEVCTHGSDFERRLRPSTSLGRSAAFLTSTATWTTGGTEDFMAFMLCAVSEVVRVPLLSRNWSMPTRPMMLPAGQSSMGST